MADATTICNLALAHIGEVQILNIDEESKEARTCKTFYDQTRDECLREHRWNFAMKRVELSRLVDKPLAKWLYQYQLPTDCLRVLEVNDFDEREPDVRFAIEGRALLTDEETANIRYIWRVNTASLFDPLFIEAFAVKLASKMAKPVTGNSTLKSDLLTEYNRITGPRAKHADAIEGKLKVRTALASSRLVRSRFA